MHPPAIPNLIPPPLPLPFPVFPLPPQVFLPQEVRPWEGSEEEEEKDLEALQLKAEEDAEDASYDAFMGNVPRGRRRHKASQTSFNSSATASSDSDSNSKELDSSDGLDSGDDEGEEEEEEEEEVALGYP